MKIAFVNLQPISYNGGAERWIRAVCKMLLERGHDVLIFVPSNRDVREKILGIEHVFFKSRAYALFKKLGMYNLFPPFLNYRFNEEVDVVYVATIHPLLLFKSVLKGNKKLIIGTHDLFIPNKRLGIDIYQKISITGISYLASKGKVLVHSLNRMTSRAFKDTSVIKFEIGNEFLTDYEAVSGSNDSTRISSKIGQPFKVLFLGNIEPRKGSRLIPSIVGQFKTSTDISFIFAGRIKDAKLLKETNVLVDNADFKGTVSEADKVNLFRESDLFLFLSDREASPIAIEEAFSFGLPVVSTWRGITQLNSFPYSLCVISGRNADEILDSITSQYNLWKRDNRKYYLDLLLRSLSYRNRFHNYNSGEAIRKMFLD
jgi:glycosyltransferase involved in cell wall biosynthesis